MPQTYSGLRGSQRRYGLFTVITSAALSAAAFGCDGERSGEADAASDGSLQEAAVLPVEDAETADAGPPPPEPVTCGNATCAPPSNLVPACCVDPETSTCGILLGVDACKVVPQEDPGCPSVNVGGLFKVASCCAEGGQCGLELTMFNMPGCTELSVVRGRYEDNSLAALLPQPQPCAGFTDAGEPDAGSDLDAGAIHDGGEDGGDAGIADDASSDAEPMDGSTEDAETGPDNDAGDAAADAELPDGSAAES